MKIVKAQIKFNGECIDLEAGKSVFRDDLFADFIIQKEEEGSQRIQLTLHPKTPILLEGISIEFSQNYTSKDRVFCNGFQSWTESREYETQESIEGLRKLASPLMEAYGDYGFYPYPNQAGILHSWTYSYVKQSKDQYAFIGSLAEFTGYTLIVHDCNNNTLTVSKDCEGLNLDHSYPALDLLISSGSEKEVFDRYFETMDIQKPKVDTATGWTSWYYHYTKISEAIILDNLAAFEDQQIPIDFFQIDDGYQTAVGDWMSIKSNFPNGMASIATKIKTANYKPGIWLAPFICEKKSAIFKNHPDWILRDADGKMVKAGYNPGWSGFFYALDFYKKEVQDYLRSVFLTVLNKWGYEMVKLDFLYAVAIIPRPHKTRGQVMSEAMTFLREIIGQKLILGCGVPLGSAFGKVDYCRIGADVHTSWEHGLLKWLKNRERVSTALAVTNTVGRHHLNGRAFINDPDVFILRKDKNKLSPEQQQSLMLLNCLLGDLLFISDNIKSYSPEQHSEYEAMFLWKDKKVQKVEERNHLVEIHFTLEGKALKAIFNFDKKEKTIAAQKGKFSLAPYESIILSV